MALLGETQASGEDRELDALIAACWADRPLLSDGEFAAISRLAGRDFAARAVDCRSCGARYSEPCLSATGLAASEPCAVRTADVAKGVDAAVTAA